jgi:NADPH2:quinone reductase
MRAITYDGSGDASVIRIGEVAEPAPGSDDALVEVAYAGLNRADILERMGRYARPKDALPIPGIEYSGVVRGVGSGVRNVSAGDRVCGLVAAGAHAERLSTNALTLAVIPDGMSLREAAAIPEAFITAHDALVSRGGFTLGETVVVHAVGSSVGLAAVALARRGGGISIGTSRTQAKLERAAGHGLDYGFLLDDGWVAAVQGATGGRGADLILDFIGAPILDANLTALAPGGRIVQIGTLGGVDARISLGLLMQKRAALHGTVLRTRALEERIALAKHLSRALLPLFARGDLRPEIDAVFSLAQMRAAHAHMEANKNFGKILIEVTGD